MIFQTARFQRTHDSERAGCARSAEHDSVGENTESHMRETVILRGSHLLTDPRLKAKA